MHLDISGTETRISSREGNSVTTKQADGEYDVAVSYAGEDRQNVEAVVESLRNAGIKIFYDHLEDEKAKLWGKNLYDYLQDVYQNKAEYCLMFVSAHYVEKRWTG